MILRNRRHDEVDVADITRGATASKASNVHEKGVLCSLNSRY